MVKICGIDEAGSQVKLQFICPKGPVIGPLVITGILIEEKGLSKLDSLNIKDSKLLTPKQRTQTYKQLITLVKYKTIKIPPKEIDYHLNSETSNLNILEAEKIAEIINELKPNKAFIDCPSNNIEAYTSQLKAILTTNTNLTLAHKADVKYKIVAGASIIAKVTRDKEIEKIKKKIGIDFNSGYPSDKITQSFLKKHWKTHPEIFRKTWASYKNVQNQNKQKKLNQF